MSSEQVVTPEVAEAPNPPPARRSWLSSPWVRLLGAVIILNILAVIFVPPYPKDGAPGDACAFPVCYIEGHARIPGPAHRLGPGR